MGSDLHGATKESNMDKNREDEITSIERAFYEWLNSLQWKKSPVAADGHACLTGTCGETIEIFLNFNGEHVKEAGYWTNGCISSKVCAALTAQMAHGKTTDELLDITAETILSQLGEFPKDEEHCAFWLQRVFRTLCTTTWLSRAEKALTGSD